EQVRVRTGSTPGAGTLHHDGDLTSYLARGPLRQFAQTTASHFLVGLGEFTADGGSAVRAESFDHRRQGRQDAMRALEEDHGSAFVRQPGQVRGQPLTWWEALETESVGGQARYHQCRERGGGAGDH